MIYLKLQKMEGSTRLKEAIDKKLAGSPEFLENHL